MLFQLLKVTAEQGVGRHHDVGIRDLAEHPFAARPVDDQPLEVGHELFGFAFPVGQHGRGHHDEVRAFMPVVDHMLDERQGLDGRAEAHFVREDAAEPVLAEEIQVRNALQLVVAEGGVQALGRADGLHLGEVPHLLTQRVPEGVGFRIGQVVEQVVEHGGFKLLELALGRLGGVEAEGL